MKDMDRTAKQKECADKKFLKMTDFLDGFLEMGTPGFDCALYHRGICVYRHWRGYRDYDNRQPVTGRELYNIYSLSKPITCTAALMLMDRGAFSLGDPLCEYLPEFAEMYVKAEEEKAGDEQGENGGMKECWDGGSQAEEGGPREEQREKRVKVRRAKNQIRIRDLFCMTAGFSYDLEAKSLAEGRDKTRGACPAREMIRYLAKEPLEFEPGTRWKYGFCHDALAVLVETVSGMRFSDFVKAHIFEPLHMEDSTFDPGTADQERIMAQYRYDEGDKRLVMCGKEIQGFKLGREYESGGAGCVSSVEDYIRFAEALRKGDVLLKKETMRLMWSNQLDERCLESFSQDWERNYGYGLGVRCPMGGSHKKDFGWGGAGGAFLAVSPEYEYSLVYMQHVMDSPVQKVKGELVRFVEEAIRGDE